MIDRVRKTPEEWRRELPTEVYAVCRERGTERPFTGEYYAFHGDGVYRCRCCGALLFDSRDKYDSGTGWPSFRAAAAAEHVGRREDRSHGMRRVEVYCAVCDAHLGHVFNDGPPPSGERYCINSVALAFEPR